MDLNSIEESIRERNQIYKEAFKQIAENFTKAEERFEAIEAELDSLKRKIMPE